MLTGGWAVSTTANVRALAFIEMVGLLISKPFSLLMAFTCHPALISAAARAQRPSRRASPSEKYQVSV